MTLSVETGLAVMRATCFSLVVENRTMDRLGARLGGGSRENAAGRPSNQ